MKKYLPVLCMMTVSAVVAQTEKLIYHDIKTDQSGKIIPWYSNDPGKAYNNAIMSVWHFWDTMRIDMNGLPYYMNHQVWTPGVNDLRGIGGDQIQMALSSWRLLYQYAGNERIKENMKFMADYYLGHGLSPSSAAWPDIPYPYNTLIYSGNYDGDMVLGKYYTQPDKAGSFGYELVQLYKLIGNRNHGQTPGGIYLESAIRIANTLARHTAEGNYESSPLPFKVHALANKAGRLKDKTGSGKEVQLSSYTSNWSPTLELFLLLIELKKGDTKAYQKAFDTILAWMIKYPLQNNRWGPFFEDIPGWSDTQINAITFGQFIMNHPRYFPQWKTQVKNIFKWVYTTLGNRAWEKYGVIVVNEQTAYNVPGNSHSSRQASAELQYLALTGDSIYSENAIRALNWATYMVDTDGKNRYPQDENWLTDGYGDYVRHYLRAFAFMPSLAPNDEDHILSSTSVIQFAEYKNSPYKKYRFDNLPADTIKLKYNTYDKQGREIIRLTQKPSSVIFNGELVEEMMSDKAAGFKWQELPVGGILIVNRTNADEVIIVE